MASEPKKAKADPPLNSEASTKARSTPVVTPPKSADGSKSTEAVKTSDAGASAASEPAAAPSNYSRGEGQKPVTAAYKENWNAIFGKKKKQKKKR